ncbi:MAG: helix-turn-helix transcriptional regulator [Clostridia bacterium]|jgi:transcriptional regulator with XRE-family HTH domain|nr:helix-turn-helix transcriptional regulator [Clostridia bacterium]
MDFNIDNFSYRLSVLLDENNMTQTQLAKEIGTSNVTICRYLTCERIPRLDVIARIASVFNVSIDYLLGFSKDKNSKNSSENFDLNIAISISKLYDLDDMARLSKNQIELIKKILLANKDFILSA